ncbi:hypothetical protein D9M69_649380 [compost metagenome]
MARHIGDRVTHAEAGAQAGQAVVLRAGEGIAFQSFQLDADGVVVAVAAAAPAGTAGVPGACVGIHKLHQLAIAADEKMRRDFHATDLLKVGMGVPVEVVGEELFHFRAAIDTGRQADGVDHDQVDPCTLGARTEIG